MKIPNLCRENCVHFVSLARFLQSHKHPLEDFSSDEQEEAEIPFGIHARRKMLWAGEERERGKSLIKYD
jgi:hypothetical protein